MINTGNKICYNFICPLDIPQTTAGCPCWETCPSYNSGPNIITTSTGTGDYKYNESGCIVWNQTSQTNMGTSSQMVQEPYNMQK